MKKKEYIVPNMVTLTLHNLPLMQTVSGFKKEVDDNNGVSGDQGLGKGGWNWSDDEPEDVDY